MAPDDDEDVYVRPMPDPEALRPYIGRIVAIDEDGAVRLAAASWDEILRAIPTEKRGEWSLLFVPGFSVVG